MSDACFADHVRLLNAAKPNLTAAEFSLLDTVHRWTGSNDGCHPRSERLRQALGFGERSLEYCIAGLTGAPSARPNSKRQGRELPILACRRERVVDRKRKSVTWRRTFVILWDNLQKCATSGEGLSAQSRTVSSVVASDFKAFALNPEAHTPRAREAVEPTDSARADEPRVCVFSETESEKANPENPKSNPGLQEGDVARRHENGPPESDAPADVNTKFAIVAGAYGPQGGHVGKARGVFAAVAAEYETILRHVNHTARARERSKPENRLWLWRYLTDTPWRWESVPLPSAPKPPPEPEFCGPPTPPHILKARSDAAREACMASLRKRGQAPEPEPAPEPEIRVVDVLESELERIEREPSGMMRNLMALEALRRGTAAPPPPPETIDDWERKAAEVRADQDVGALGDLVRGLAASKTEAMTARPYTKREFIAASNATSAPQVSASIEDKLSSARRMGVEGDALLDIARKVDREGRSDAELRELIELVMEERVT